MIDDEVLNLQGCQFKEQLNYSTWEQKGKSEIENEMIVTFFIWNIFLYSGLKFQQ